MSSIHSHYTTCTHYLRIPCPVFTATGPLAGSLAVTSSWGDIILTIRQVIPNIVNTKYNKQGKQTSLHANAHPSTKQLSPSPSLAPSTPCHTHNTSRLHRDMNIVALARDMQDLGICTIYRPDKNTGQCTLCTIIYRVPKKWGGVF